MLALSYTFILVGMVQAALGAVIDPSPRNVLSNREVGTRLMKTTGPSLDDMTNEDIISVKNDVGLKLAIGALIAQEDSSWAKKHIKSDHQEESTTDSATFTIYKDGKNKIEKKITLEDVRNMFPESHSDRIDWWWLGCITALQKEIAGDDDLTKKQADPANILKWLTGKEAKSVTGLSDKKYFENIQDKVVVLVNDKNDPKVEQWSFIKDIKGDINNIDDAEVHIANFNTTSGNQFWLDVGYTGLAELTTDYDTMIVLDE